jgi:hypothetical protein
MRLVIITEDYIRIHATLRNILDSSACRQWYIRKHEMYNKCNLICLEYRALSPCYEQNIQIRNAGIYTSQRASVFSPCQSEEPFPAIS